ncbi:deoxyribosephosphate aldolase [Acanthamoeba castellanii str. Neff]|uniref:deoxyribose-phosphate aldolase n=1 Tax=Acanthamoeba castellanii (strain ATCC 30010 / Neff) TaxID=1257118 RepID=L8HIU4_ACACF|nr:deoxyribosephosphate aldolase [Acanthamoeba castellanii str. Neff]ELR25529.1 deoxyribosephosphate aldolase [Acanthamoeba castellanii str. Neff]
MEDEIVKRLEVVCGALALPLAAAAEAREAEVAKLCQEAFEHSFAAVCVNGCWAQFALQTLRALHAQSPDKQPVKVACVVGFPLGASTSETKAFETKQLVELGVDEIDMVVNVGRLKDQAYGYVLGDIKAVVTAATRADGSQAVVKVILETGALTREEIIDGCLLSSLAGAHFVKTSTGFNAAAGGAKVEHVALMKKAVGDRLQVKASGGVRSAADVQAMVAAGASRIGTSSGVALPLRFHNVVTEAELHKLHRRFQKLDKDGSGSISADEFLSIPELAGNPLLSRIIAIFDTNKDEEIEFTEFVKALSTFTNRDNLEGKLRFTFQVYDIDNDGFISNGELFQVLKMMVGSNLTDAQLQNIVDKTILEADEDKDGKISYEEFVKLITNTEELGAKLTITL